MSQSEFELPLSRTASTEEPQPSASMVEADPATHAEAAAWTLWGRRTANGFNGKPKDDFSMDGSVFTG